MNQLFSWFEKFLVGAAVVCLMNCGITDGPNSTGESFLNEQNLVIASELQSVTIEYPIDSFWIESFEPNHLNSTFFMLSNENGFDVKSRMGFYFPFDTLNESEDEDETADTLWMNFALMNFHGVSHENIPDELISNVEKLGGQSLIVSSIIVDSILKTDLEALNDTETDDASDSDTLELESAAIELKNSVAQNMMGFWDSLNLANASAGNHVFVSDTIILPELDSITADEIFKTKRLPLPNLFDSLKARYKLSQGQWVFLEVKLAEEDSSGITFRYQSQFLNSEKEGVLTLTNWVDDTTKIKTPLSLLSFTHESFTTNPLAVNYSIEHPLFRDQSSPTMLLGKSQGIHLIFDRDNLIKAIQKADPTLEFTNDENENVNNYYIPFAEFTFPIDTSSIFIEDDDYLKFRLQSILDTLPQLESEEASETTYPGRTLPLVMEGEDAEEDEKAEYNIFNTISKQVLDTLRLYYQQKNDRYQIIFNYSNNEHQNDTVNVSLKEDERQNSFEYNHRYASFAGTISLKFLFDPSAEELTYSIYRESGTLNEPNQFEESESLEDNLPRYLTQEKSEFKMRSTMGMQRLINLGSDLYQYDFDFFLKPEIGYTMIGDEARSLGYFPLSEVPLKLDDEGNLTIGIEVFFYGL